MTCHENDTSNHTEAHITSLQGEQNEAPKKTKVDLNGVAKTLLLTLVARAYDFSTPSPILRDPFAGEVVVRLDVDITEMVMTPTPSAAVAVRTSTIDRWTADFLQNTPDTTVLHLACGFDSRMDRVKWGRNTRWIDIDLPEVINLRRKVLHESLAGRDYSLLGIDVLDEKWMHSFSAEGPVLVIMEGLLCYLPEDDVKRLIQRFCQTFCRGELLFECINSTTLQSLNERKPIQPISSTGVEFYWSVDDPKSLELIHPRLKLVESIRLAEAPGVEKGAIGYRALMYLLSWIPSLRDSARFMRFQFGDIRGVTYK